MDIHQTICVPVFGVDQAAFAAQLESLKPHFNLVELRVDSLKEFDEQIVAAVVAACPMKAVFTCRLKEDGGQFEADMRRRNEVLQFAFSLDVRYVDIELEHIAEFSFDALERDKLLLSHHNFECTPKLSELRSLLEQMKEHRAAAYKIATQVKSDEDCRTLYRLLLEARAEGTPIAVVGMGPRGRATRIVAPMLGSLLSFSEPVGTSAPRALGQFSAKRMKEIFDLIY